MNGNSLLNQARARIATAIEFGSGRFLLTRAEVARTLEAYIAGQISDDDLAGWAELFDVNETVDLEDDELLPAILFELSSPEVNGQITAARARELVTLLRE